MDGRVAARPEPFPAPVREKAAREQAAREQAAREQAARGLAQSAVTLVT